MVAKRGLSIEGMFGRNRSLLTTRGSLIISKQKTTEKGHGRTRDLTVAQRGAKHLRLLSSSVAWPADLESGLLTNTMTSDKSSSSLDSSFLISKGPCAFPRVV